MPIFDQGYQHWQGTLAGHGWRWLAVARHGVRTQLQNRSVRMLLMVAWLPALGLGGVLALWGLVEQRNETAVGIMARLLGAELVAEPEKYRAAVWTVTYAVFFKAELLCAVFLVLLVGPNLVSRDLRFNALPLYLSRPVRRLDYFAGKLAVIAFFIAATIALPAAGGYALGLAFSLNLGVVWDTYHLLFAGIGYGAAVGLSAGTLVLALSSLSRRSVYVGLAWAGLVLLTQLFSGILVGIEQSTVYREQSRDGMAQWVKDHPPPPGVRMVDGRYPSYQTGGTGKPDEDKARDEYVRAWEAANRRQRANVQETIAAREATDWRPLVSYANNLGRLGDALLGSQPAWEKVGGAAGGPGGGGRGRGGPVVMDDEAAAERGKRVAQVWVWQYPWYWSAAVLAGLWAASVVVLSRRVKSLDRLK